MLFMSCESPSTTSLHSHLSPQPEMQSQCLTAWVQRVTHLVKSPHALSRVVCACSFHNPVYLAKTQREREGKWPRQARAGAACLDGVSPSLLGSLTMHSCRQDSADGALPEWRKWPRPCSATVLSASGSPHPGRTSTCSPCTCICGTVYKHQALLDLTWTQHP